MNGSHPEAVLRFEVGQDGPGAHCYVEIDGETVGELMIAAGPQLHLERGLAMWHIAVPMEIGSDGESFTMRTMEVWAQPRKTS